MTIPEYFFAFLLVGSATVGLASLAHRLQNMERKLSLVLAHLGIDPTAHVSPSSDVIRLAADPKQRIAAIKAYRHQTGAGLKDAAAVIDGIASGTNGAGA